MFYDDSCDLCESTVKKLRTDIDLDAVGASETLPEGMSKEALMYQMHAMDENGVMYRGIDAVIVILRWHPLGRYVAPISALPGIKHLGALVYRIIASNRHRWFGKRS